MDQKEILGNAVYSNYLNFFTDTEAIIKQMQRFLFCFYFIFT